MSNRMGPDPFDKRKQNRIFVKANIKNSSLVAGKPESHGNFLVTTVSTETLNIYHHWSVAVIALAQFAGGSRRRKLEVLWIVYYAENTADHGNNSRNPRGAGGV